MSNPSFLLLCAGGTLGPLLLYPFVGLLVFMFFSEARAERTSPRALLVRQRDVSWLRSHTLLLLHRGLCCAPLDYTVSYTYIRLARYLSRTRDSRIRESGESKREREERRWVAGLPMAPRGLMHAVTRVILDSRDSAR